MLTKLTQRIKQLIKSIWDKFNNLSRKKKLVVIVIILALLIVGFWLYRRVRKKPAYVLETAKLGSITEVVTETGNVTTAGYTPIYSTTTGLVEEVFVGNGNFISKGDTLFKVIATATQEEKDDALADYLDAKNALETAKATLYSEQADMFTDWDAFMEIAQSDEYEEEDGTPKHEKRSAAEFHIPQKDWLAAEITFKNQQSLVNEAQVDMSAKWQAYQATQDSEVKAILDGQIINLGISKGDTIKVPTATTLSSTVPALVLKHIDTRTTVKLDIGEIDAVKVQADQPATIEIDAIPDQTFSGHVDRIDTLTTPSDGVVQYSAYVILDESSPKILGGLTADVNITVATKENILTVPSSAVKPYEGGRAVRVVGDKGEIEYIPVKIGIRGNGATQILSGISEGIEVIVALKNEQVERNSSGLF